MRRYAFGDEAGETGFRFEQGSSRFFVVALVLIDDPQTLREQIEQLKWELGVSARYEFKFNKTSKRFRLAFFSMIRNAEFQARALVVDKQKLASHWQRLDKLSFYVCFVTELVFMISPVIWRDTYLILDRFGQHRETVRRVRQSIKDHRLGLKGILAKRSEGEPLIQLADMIAGALFRCYSTGDPTYIDMVASKVEVWNYHNKEHPPS
jgi:hypothetical protein